MLVFESTKQTPIPQQDLAPILKSPPHTYVRNHGNDNCGNKWSWHTSIFKQKPTWISCVKRSKINVTHLSRKNNATTASNSRPSLSLSSLVTRKLLQYLQGSYLLPDHNPSFKCFVSQIFSFSFFFKKNLPSLSIYSWSANIRPVHSNWALSSLYHYKTCPLNADWLQVYFGTRSDAGVKSVFQKSLSAPLNALMNLFLTNMQLFSSQDVNSVKLKSGSRDPLSCRV